MNTLARSEKLHSRLALSSQLSEALGCWQANAAKGSCRPAASFRSEDNFALFGSPRGVTQRLQDVLSLQVWIIGENLVNAVTSADLSHPRGKTWAHPLGS